LWSDMRVFFNGEMCLEGMIWLQFGSCKYLWYHPYSRAKLLSWYYFNKSFALYCTSVTFYFILFYFIFAYNLESGHFESM
jgi:hypothetical protein